MVQTPTARHCAVASVPGRSGIIDIGQTAAQSMPSELDPSDELGECRVPSCLVYRTFLSSLLRRSPRKERTICRRLRREENSEEGLARVVVVIKMPADIEDDLLKEKNPPPLDEDDIALLKTYVSVCPSLRINFKNIYAHRSEVPKLLKQRDSKPNENVSMVLKEGFDFHLFIFLSRWVSCSGDFIRSYGRAGLTPFPGAGE